MKSGEMEGLGKGFEETVRPWALVFMKNDETFKLALGQEAKKMYRPNARPKLRVWYDSIQVW